MSNISIYKPTWLYIKRHAITGMLYFGKTTRNGSKFSSYLGSGTYWKKHINKHGKQFVETIWFCLYTDQDELTNAAISMSKILELGHNSLWANNKFENGLDGGSIKGSISVHTRKLMSDIKSDLKHIEIAKANLKIAIKANTGNKRSLETRQKQSMSGRGLKKPSLSNNHKDSIKAFMIGSKVYNNGIIAKRFSVCDDIPVGWVPGYLPKR